MADVKPLKLVDTGGGEAELREFALGEKIPAENLGVPSSFGTRNLLINGNFAINQRGYVSGAATASANQYTLDRWRVVVSGQSLIFASAGNGKQITAPAGGVEQVIEGVNVSGGTYSLSWSGTATADVNGVAVSNGGTFTLPANTNATVRFYGGTVSLAQLELGDRTTQFAQRLYGQELALCQRYYYTYSLTFGGYAVSGFSVITQVNHTMRAAPTAFVAQGAKTTGWSDTTVLSMGPDRAAWFINNGSGTTGNGSSLAVISLDAEL